MWAAPFFDWLKRNYGKATCKRWPVKLRKGLSCQNLLEGAVVGIIPGCAINCKFHRSEGVCKVGQDVTEGARDHFGWIAECTTAKSAQNQYLGAMDSSHRQNFASAL